MSDRVKYHDYLQHNLGKLFHWPVGINEGLFDYDGTDGVSIRYGQMSEQMAYAWNTPALRQKVVSKCVTAWATHTWRRPKTISFKAHCYNYNPGVSNVDNVYSVFAFRITGMKGDQTSLAKSPIIFINASAITANDTQGGMFVDNGNTKIEPPVFKAQGNYSWDFTVDLDKQCPSMADVLDPSWNYWILQYVCPTVIWETYKTKAAPFYVQRIFVN